MEPLGPEDLRKLTIEEGLALQKKIKRQPIYFILEDVLDTYNIGAFFRLAEAVAVNKLYLCGRTPTPPDGRIEKASVGSFKLVPWEYCEDVASVVKELRQLKQVMIVAVELHPKAVAYNKINYKFPLALVFGSENYGMKSETLQLADAITQVPMYGLNRALNVAVAAGIVAYHTLDNQ